jgi:NADH-quinone oxidoreductase subunit J
MDAVTSSIPLLVFVIVGTIAVASSILVVAMRNPVHSALFLLLTFLCVAVLFVMEGAEFVGAVQVLVYAGGIMVLFLFVVMLINVRNLPDDRILSPYWTGGALVGAAVFVLLVALVRPGVYHEQNDNPRALRSTTVNARHRVVQPDGRTVRKRYTRQQVVGNSEAIGMALYRDYLVPFEVASLFLLVAMVGAILIGKRELGSDDEDVDPQYIVDRVAEEKEIKEAMSA